MASPEQYPPLMKVIRHLMFISRLEALLADKESEHSEAIATLKTKQHSEMQKNKELFAASEATNTDLQKEVRIAFSQGSLYEGRGGVDSILLSLAVG